MIINVSKKRRLHSNIIPLSEKNCLHILFSSEIDVYEVSFTNIAKLDGKFIMADNGNGGYWVQDLLPMFANGKIIFD